MNCTHCGRPIWRNPPSDEWFHDSTGERECTDYEGSLRARPSAELARYVRMVDAEWDRAESDYLEQA